MRLPDDHALTIHTDMLTLGQLREVLPALTMMCKGHGDEAKQASVIASDMLLDYWIERELELLRCKRQKAVKHE